MRSLSVCPWPLYVSMIMKNAVKWRSSFDVSQLVLPCSVEAFINQLLDDLENRLGVVFVSHTLAFITIANNGLCEVPGRFVPWTIRTFLDCSYHGLFIPSLDDSYHVEKGNIVCTVRVKKSPLKNPPRFSDIFFQNGSEFSVQILHASCTFIPTIDYKFLFNYLQL